MILLYNLGAKGKALLVWAAEMSTSVNNVKIQHGDVRRQAMALRGHLYSYIVDLDHQISACCQRQVNSHPNYAVQIGLAD